MAEQVTTDVSSNLSLSAEKKGIYMRLIDLVVECLKETIRNEDKTLSVDGILEGKVQNHPEYDVEFNNVLLSINKAVARLSTLDKIPYKHDIITANQNVSMYNISSIHDLKNIKSVFIIKNDKPLVIGWRIVTKTMIMLPKGLNDTIHIIYAPKVKTFTEEDVYREIESNGNVIKEAIDTGLEEYGISDEYCHYICYFAKSELFESRDPDRCKRYLNYFEQFVSEVIIDKTYPHQECVHAEYRIR